VELLKEWLRVEALGYWDFPWRTLLSHRTSSTNCQSRRGTESCLHWIMEEPTEEAVAVLKVKCLSWRSLNG